MKRLFTVSAILLFVAIVVSGKPNQGAPQKKQSSEAQGQTPPPTLVGNSTTYDQSQHPKSGSPKWYASPEWWLVAIASLTAYAIWIQAKETARAAGATVVAAKAAKDSADALIASERAWILVDLPNVPDDFEPNPNMLQFLELRPVIKNYGRTAARMTKVSIRQHQIANGVKLPTIPVYEGETPVDIILPPDLPLQPMKVLVASHDFVPIRNGQTDLYVYGFIDYLDLGGKDHRSCFCFTYVIPHGFTVLRRGFYVSGEMPPAYTQCK